MELGLKYYPDEVLRRVAEPITQIDEEFRALVARMFEMMYATRGVGLAAPQVGVSLRLLLINPTGDLEQRDLERAYLNPEIVEREGSVRGEEGCLSLPGLNGKILRAQKILVRYLNLEGNVCTEEAEDWKARIFQHEIDHLDGILIIDKMTPAELTFYEQDIKEFEELHREGKTPRARQHAGSAEL